MTGANGAREDADFYIRFWGVRGTIACPGPEFMRYGGNTSCIEVRCGKRLIILDAGTGLRPLGSILEKNGPIKAEILLTHTHLDHIAGLPFFVPMFKAGNIVRMAAGHLLQQGKTLKGVVKQIMQAPLFPVPMEALEADLSFHDFDVGETIRLGEHVQVRTAPLNHPNGATGYRVEYGGRSVCYITDTEHVEDKLDENILGLIDGCDIFIYDATYTDDEYPAHRGWGHSTWQQGARLADAGGVGNYVVFHHAPEHTDNSMDQISDQVRTVRANSVVAREGLILRP
jgi:phosphoribosyl 1,2-cyclic phosphodiesterase